MLSEWIEPDIEFCSSSFFASTFVVGHRINNGYLIDRVGNTDQTIAVS